MKGWHREPYRHSLAARGIKTHPAIISGLEHDPAWWAERKYWLMSQRDFDDVDVGFEIELIESTRDTWIRLWNQRDRDLNILRHSIDKQNVDRNIHRYPGMNVIFHSDPDYHGRGVGGPGIARSFWIPYTYMEGEKFIGVIPNVHLDNIALLAHEISHAFGSHTEFGDYWNNLVAYVVHIEHGTINPEILSGLDEVGSRVAVYGMGDAKRKDMTTRNSFAILRYLYKTYGEDYMDQLMLMSGDIVRKYPEDLNKRNLEFIKEGLRLG